MGLRCGTEVTFFAAPSAEADRGAEEKHCSLAVKPGDRIKAALVAVHYILVVA